MDVDEDVLALVREHMLRDAKIAKMGDRVYKDECLLCFATSESPGGLYINLRTFQVFGEEHVDLDQERTNAVLYLHEVARRVSWARPVVGGAPARRAAGGCSNLCRWRRAAGGTARGAGAVPEWSSPCRRAGASFRGGAAAEARQAGHRR